MIQDAPTKDELATHDGVVWFPKELMPIEQDPVNKQANSLIGPAQLLMKTKSLNLKLKFKNTKHKRYIKNLN